MKTERPICDVCQRILPPDVLVGTAPDARVVVCSCPCAERERRELSWKPVERRHLANLPPMKAPE